MNHGLDRVGVVGIESRCVSMGRHESNTQHITVMTLIQALIVALIAAAGQQRGIQVFLSQQVGLRRPVRDVLHADHAAAKNDAIGSTGG